MQADACFFRSLFKISKKKCLIQVDLEFRGHLVDKSAKNSLHSLSTFQIFVIVFTVNIQGYLGSRVPRVVA